MSVPSHNFAPPLSYADARYQESLRVARKRVKEIRSFYVSASLYARNHSVAVDHQPEHQQSTLGAVGKPWAGDWASWCKAHGVLRVDLSSARNGEQKKADDQRLAKS